MLGPFFLVLVVLAWLPFQNAIVAVLTEIGILPAALSQYVVLLKEVILLGVGLWLIFQGKVRRWNKTDLAFVLFTLWVTSHLPFGESVICRSACGTEDADCPYLGLLSWTIPSVSNPRVEANVEGFADHLYDHSSFGLERISVCVG